jgi:hypothetical protein
MRRPERSGAEIGGLYRLHGTDIGLLTDAATMETREEEALLSTHVLDRVEGGTDVVKNAAHIADLGVRIGPKPGTDATALDGRDHDGFVNDPLLGPRQGEMATCRGSLHEDLKIAVGQHDRLNGRIAKCADQDTLSYGLERSLEAAPVSQQVFRISLDWRDPHSLCLVDG